MGSKICLKELDRKVLVHEAAHARHFALDPDLSLEYDKLFPTIRLPYERWDDPAVQFRNGLVSPYAAFDYNLDNGGKEQQCPQTEKAALSQKRWGIQIDIHGEKDYWLERALGGRKYAPKRGELLLQKVFRLVQELPGKLAEHARHIIIDPELNNLGVCYYDALPTAVHDRTTESIAEHTTLLDCVVRNPTEYPKIIDLLSEVKLARQRLDFLITHGFLDKDYYHKLRS